MFITLIINYLTNKKYIMLEERNIRQNINPMIRERFEDRI